MSASIQNKLDLKDRKILYALNSNARSSCSQIAKAVGLSPEVVHYRINRLEKEDIITQYQLIVNLSKLNILQFKICLEFQHLKSTKLDEIIGKLKVMEQVKWIVSCNGSWDLIVAIETDSLENVDLLKCNVLALFEGYVSKKAISLLVEAQTYERDYLINTTTLRTKSRIIMKNDNFVKIDDFDTKLLKKLAENARKSVIDIAAELKTTARVVAYKIKQLEKNRIILGYKIAINYEKLGIKFYKTFVYLDNITDERKKRLIGFLAQHKNVIHDVVVLGNWDLEPEFEVYSEQEFNDILTEMRDNFSDIIKNVDVITINKEHKFVYF